MQYNLAGFGEVDRNNRGGSILVAVVRTILTYLADGNRDPYRSLQLAPYDWGVQKRKGPVQITDKCMVPGTIPRYSCHVAHCYISSTLYNSFANLYCSYTYGVSAYVGSINQRKTRPNNISSFTIYTSTYSPSQWTELQR
jgi:hypothetical protein